MVKSHYRCKYPSYFKTSMENRRPKMNHFHINRLFLEPNQSYFLFGPRGTGKSTMVIHRHPNAMLLNLLLSNIQRQFLARPEMLLDVVRSQPRGQTIII